VCGVVGLVWVPSWLATLKAVPAGPAAEKKPEPIGGLLKDSRFYGIVVTNMFIMTLYSVWTNWTTLYFVQVHHMTAIEANRKFAWLPPVFATLGGAVGAWLVMFWIRRGVAIRLARVRVAWCAAIVLLTTALIPFAPSAEWAAAGISLSYFASVALSTTVYSSPIDLFGPGRAGFCVAALTLGYGLMQTFLSPYVGKTIDRVGFSPVFTALSFVPLLGAGIFHWTRRRT